MFRKVVRRFTLGALLVVSVAALTAATGGSAGVGFVTTQTVKSHDGATPPNQCPGLSPYVNERHYCLDVTTYNNLKKSGGAEVDLTLENWDQSALSNPTTKLFIPAALSFVSSDPAICSPAAGGEVDCSWANIPGLGSASGTTDPCNPPPTGSPPGPSCPTVKLFFTVDSTGDPVTFVATATAKESGNDKNGANVETQTVDSQSLGGPATMTFDSGTGAGASADATVVLPIEHFNKPHLIATVAGLNSSLDFQSGSPAFIAQFAASTGTACVLNVTCAGLDLNTDLSGAAGGTFSANNQILWTADVASNNTNILAVHTYDPVSITPAAPNTLSTAGTRFASCNGVVFTDFGTNPQASLSVGPTYFVRNATTSNGKTSFQVSATAKGSLINVTGTGSFSGSCVRIIGDDKSEKVTGCTTDPPPASLAPKVPPGLCAAKVNNTTVRAYLWDDSNGHVGY